MWLKIMHMYKYNKKSNAKLEFMNESMDMREIRMRRKICDEHWVDQAWLSGEAHVNLDDCCIHICEYLLLLHCNTISTIG